jgi:hypothetical protein
MPPELSIAGFGFPLKEPRIHLVPSFEDEETLYGHDAVVWDVSSSLKGSSVLDQEAFDRREEELEHHLSHGTPLVVMLPSPSLYRVKGRDEVRIPEDLLPFEIELVRAKGKAGEPLGGASATRFWEFVDDLMQFYSYLTEPLGEPLMRIKGTTHVVASLIRTEAGIVLLLPRISPYMEYVDKDEEEKRSAATDFVDHLLELLKSYRPDRKLPGWSDAYLLSGEHEEVLRLKRDENRLSKLQGGIERRRQQLASRRSRKALFTAQGPALEEVVDRALQALGFRVDPGPHGRTDRLISLGRRIAVVEIKGKSKSAAEKDAAQLAKWVSHHHAETGRRPKGILIVNGWLKSSGGAAGSLPAPDATVCARAGLLPAEWPPVAGYVAASRRKQDLRAQDGESAPKTSRRDFRLRRP